MPINKLTKPTEEYISDSLVIHLENIHIIIFPDWFQSEELLIFELAQVIKTIINYPHSNQITLLIYSHGSDLEEANLLISAVAMNLLIEENFDITDECEISLIANLDHTERNNLINFIHARIVLKYENLQALELFSDLQKVPAYKIEYFSNLPHSKLIADLGNRLFTEGKWQWAIEQYKKYIQTSKDAVIYWRFSQCYRNLRQVDRYFSLLEEGINIYPTEPSLHFSLILELRYNGRNQEAIISAEKASELFPDDYTFHLLKHLTVPTIYNNPEEIQFYRERYIQGLENLIKETSLDTPEECKATLAATSRLTNFYLSYQAQNDVDLQRQYGQLLHNIMAANFPQWVTSLPMPKLQPQEKIRIGYASHYLHSYSGTLWLTGWLSYCDHQNFEIYCYYIGDQPDPITQKFKECSDFFRHIPHNLPAVCEQILADQLHILVYPEIGMHPPTMQMAALRLAPVQCVAWGHPVTTGLPTIDYFLSGELMEGENAQEHYSEKLILLPNIGVSYPKPHIPPVVKTRSDYGLSDDDVIYLCCQAPFKYLPQYDFILAAIASRVPNAKFIFLRGTVLKPRLERAFVAVGLNSEDYCVHLTIPERLDYLMINLLSDVYLDTITWSGGNTSLEAIACSLPIVTCPGEFMRGRHTDSFLKMIGVTDTIASNEQEYIEIAVNLGLDKNWRQNIIDKMRENKDRLFDDQVCVKGLEDFYKQVVINKL